MSPRDRIMTLKALTAMRAQWQLWLILTVSLNPFADDRTIAVRRADRLLCDELNGEAPHPDDEAVKGAS